MKKINIRKLCLIALECLAVVIVGLSLTLSFARGASVTDDSVRVHTVR